MKMEDSRLRDRNLVSIRLRSLPVQSRLQLFTEQADGERLQGRRQYLFGGNTSTCLREHRSARE